VSQQGIGMTSQRTRERLIQRLMDQGITRFEVLEAIRSVPRHLFVDEALAHRSYEDTALPIGYGQTLSQPYVVARMSELALAQGRPKKVLELGSGSGYQTAILASLVDEICAIERIKPLLERARKQLRALRVRNVRLRHGDGLDGWASEAPFDLILGAAAPEHLPTQLLEQLAPGGRLILPVGGERQQLMMVTATPEGYVEEVIEEVNFVPMVRGVTR
jgi:protein-L-isoaspartate(D-aspartate) O-methyltransferase